MGKSAANEHLNRTLNTYLESIQETTQLVSDMEIPPPSLHKIPWTEVTSMAEQISKRATITGMLWNGEAPDAKDLEENMSTYFKMLQGLLLLSHGSTIGAGPTLRSCIHTSAKLVVNCSISLLKEAVFLYGTRNGNGKLSIPQLAGCVWNACDSLKKTPTTNYTAIGRAITQVAVSVKDVLRELKELKSASVDPQDGTPDGADAESSHQSDSDESESAGELGNDLSPEEMTIAKSAVSFVTDTLTVIKELLRFITGLLKRHDESSDSVDSLERLLEVSQRIGVKVDDLGACLYPPQEHSAIKLASENISSYVSEMKAEVLSLEDSPECFLESCKGLSKSLSELQSELGRSDAPDLVTAVQNLAVSM